jgi:hypothetical protein
MANDGSENSPCAGVIDLATMSFLLDKKTIDEDRVSGPSKEGKRRVRRDRAAQ